MLGPLRFRPILKEKVWGGERLAERLGKPAAPGTRIGESWELSDRPGDVTPVAEGPWKGRRLDELVKGHADALFGAGPGPLPNGRFPLLVKFIDSAQRLSVQVHPDDAWAAAHGLEDPGKTECWYVLEAPPEGVMLGVKPGTAPQRFAELARAGRVAECLHLVPAARGELLFCPAGTVHALLPPMMMVEVQQNSDVTFRLHDWGRANQEGNPRPLHVEQALDATHLGPVADLRPRPVRRAEKPFAWEELINCAKFAVSRWTFDRAAEVGPRADTFEILIALEGRGALRSADAEPVEVRPGDTVLVPACVRRYVLEPETRQVLLHVAARGPGAAPTP